MTKQSKSCILLYHGVTDQQDLGIANAQGKHISAEEFDQQMAYIAANANPLSLRDYVRALQGEIPLLERAVAVTFDDSYRNVCEVGLPILKKYGVPATFFISTGFVGTDRMFWTDRVEVQLNNTVLEEINCYLEGRHRSFPLDNRELRYQALVKIKKAMKKMSPNDRDTFLQQLEEQAEVDVNHWKEIGTYQQLNWDQVRELDEGIFDVGGHSVNHEILAYLDQENLVYEVNHCIESLECELGHTVDLFSYPEGQHEHYNEEVIAVLKKAGVRICPSAISGFNEIGDDPFHMRRVMVGFMGEPFPFHD